MENDYSGYNLVKSRHNIKIYQREDPNYPSIPFLRLEMETYEVYPDQIFNLFSDDHILDQKVWNY